MVTRITTAKAILCSYFKFHAVILQLQYSVRFVVVGDDREPELDGPAPEVGPGGLPQLPTVGMALAVGL